MENTKKVYQIVFTTETKEHDYGTISGNLYESELDAYKYVYKMSMRMATYKETILSNLEHLNTLTDYIERTKYENRLLEIECPIPELKIEEHDMWDNHYPFTDIYVIEMEMICNSQTL